jgi:hypothetical protein
MEASDLQITTFRPPMGPTTDVTAPTMPFPTCAFPPPALPPAPVLSFPVPPFSDLSTRVVVVTVPNVDEPPVRKIEELA